MFLNIFTTKFVTKAFFLANAKRIKSKCKKVSDKSSKKSFSDKSSEKLFRTKVRRNFSDKSSEENPDLADGQQRVVDVADDGPADEGQARAGHDAGHEVAGNLGPMLFNL
jgi:hypothetical protein